MPISGKSTNTYKRRAAIRQWLQDIVAGASIGLFIAAMFVIGLMLS